MHPPAYALGSVLLLGEYSLYCISTVQWERNCAFIFFIYFSFMTSEQNCWLDQSNVKQNHKMSLYHWAK